MSAIRCLAGVVVSAWVCHSFGLADEPGKVTATASFLTISGTTGGQPHGFLGMCGLEIDEQPAAAFGLYQAAGQKPQYTYLILFKPDPKAERGSGHGGEGPSQIGSDGNVSCDLKMQAFVGGREIAVRLQLERNPEKVTKQILAAKKELIEKSPEAKKFFGAK